MLDAAVALLLAARCVACREVLACPTRGPVCGACWDAVPWYTGSLCGTCGAPCLPGLLCRCDDRPAHLAAIACAARFDGPMRDVIHAFKYAGHQTLAVPLAERLVDHPHLRLDTIDLIVPVPLHPWRRFVRGFNQAERIAQRLGRPVAHVLARPRWTTSQAGLQADERGRNVREAFTIAPRLTRHGRHELRRRLWKARVLLVDDVVTTGATLSACARLLREAGAREVRAATVARTVR